MVMAVLDDLNPKETKGEALAQVDEAVVSHESGTAVVKLNVDVDNAVLKEAVEAQDYKVTGIN